MIRVTYIAEEWSLRENGPAAPKDAKPGDRVYCGPWDSWEAFREGALPGRYRIEEKGGVCEVTLDG